MGTSISSLRDALVVGDKKAKDDVLQQLLFLVNAANCRLDIYQAEIEKQFRNREVEKDTAIQGHRAQRWERGYRVGVTNEATKGISEIIDSFFGGEKKDEKGEATESPILAGFKKVVGTALDIILGNTMAGEQEEIKWFVFAHHNAIIRVDVRMWRYNFVGKGVMAESENVFCYVFCTSVVDHHILIDDELVYLLSEHGGDEHVEAYLGYLFRIWMRIDALRKDPATTMALTTTLPPFIKSEVNPSEDKAKEKEESAIVQEQKDAAKKKNPVEIVPTPTPSAETLTATI